MEEKKGPFASIMQLFKSLSGGYDQEFDDEEGYDKEELAKLNKMSEKNIKEIEEKSGTQTMSVKEESDRLGIKKPVLNEQSKKEVNPKSLEEKDYEDR